jgi:alpha/beta superfamily hydrolase
MPKFDTNEPERIHFIVEIPIHKAFINGETDQVTDQVKELKNNDLNKTDVTKKRTKKTKTDQVTDQVENGFFSGSNALVNHLKN